MIITLESGVVGLLRELKDFDLGNLVVSLLAALSVCSRILWRFCSRLCSSCFVAGSIFDKSGTKCFTNDIKFSIVGSTKNNGSIKMPVN